MIYKNFEEDLTQQYYMQNSYAIGIAAFTQ
jgi:hypothetical protein